MKFKRKGFKMNLKNEESTVTLPGLNCGLCGYKSCDDFAALIKEKPSELERCIHLLRQGTETKKAPAPAAACMGCMAGDLTTAAKTYKDSLGRDFDFVLETFPNEPGPRETILPHNPARTKDMDIKKGDILIGRPMGMSCGCPITHCGVVMNVDPVNGVIVWCVTGPLKPRMGEHKDIGYYTALAYDGIVAATKTEIKIGMRYWFMPHRCMLQWRHSGLVNFINKSKLGLQIHVEGLYIG